MKRNDVEEVLVKRFKTTNDNIFTDKCEAERHQFILDLYSSLQADGNTSTMKINQVVDFIVKNFYERKINE